jgi:hypothetical protein
MCCFSARIDSVQNTRIFARPLPENRQALVYAMSLDTPKDVAMILPFPVAPGSGEDAVQFISLEKYPDFFTDLHLCFNNPKSFSRANDDARPVAGGALKIHEVGAFNASFVPTIKDFGRLDAQFRLPDGVWEKLGNYAKYGFAVFKLRKGRADVHPMAFTFPTAMPGKVFFPTVHIHDGIVHDRAEFDHVLYCQPMPRGLVEMHRWGESEDLASRRVDAKKSKGLVDGKAHVYRRAMNGKMANKDVIVTT